MATWAEFEAEAPELALRVRRLFDAGRHKTIATLRADGSPRISGIECEFVDGELQFGSMTRSRKGADLQADPRFALHGPTVHPVDGCESEWPGEAKVSGRARFVGPLPGPADGDADTEADAPAPEGDLFVADVDSVVLTSLDPSATKLVIESWSPAGGLRRVERT